MVERDLEDAAKSGDKRLVKHGSEETYAAAECEREDRGGEFDDEARQVGENGLRGVMVRRENIQAETKGTGEKSRNIVQGKRQKEEKGGEGIEINRQALKHPTRRALKQAVEEYSDTRGNECLHTTSTINKAPSHECMNSPLDKANADLHPQGDESINNQVNECQVPHQENYKLLDAP
ncbi:hypothetical protein BV22DRAFT_1052053 [Leucogyrophana mollusca]|uniref:Uncharacterized protein n=1 Tax=Leucogyrophana mollusca TaxID=85980 RepID=A0ACB8AWQ4_9AGAM|nr:hypothetical protein BV22DRAFT_1052053 [Leucogyrophana mollusca]